MFSFSATFLVVKGQIGRKCYVTRLIYEVKFHPLGPQFLPFFHNPGIAQSSLDDKESELGDITQAPHVWLGFPQGCQAGVVLGSE